MHVHQLLGVASLLKAHDEPQDPGVYGEWAQAGRLLQGAPSDLDSSVVALRQGCPRASTQSALSGCPFTNSTLPHPWGPQLAPLGGSGTLPGCGDAVWVRGE